MTPDHLIWGGFTILAGKRTTLKLRSEASEKVAQITEQRQSLLAGGKSRELI
jgi:hypothetical protein